MPDPNRTQKLAWLAIPAVMLVAACTTSAAGTPTPGPTGEPAASAVARPTPSMSPNSVMQVSIANATGNEVTVDITDESGTLRDAVSGTPGDGASVEPYVVLAENVDATTLRLTWTGGPCDVADTLAIDSTGRTFLLVEPECPGDAVAFDRVLLLHLSSPIDAAEVHAVLQDGLDTEG